ncbi:nuclear transport factor 2 family protein [Streptomyces sp. N2-109]|uniref:Nuclear transport factor 2 family protein n=1 Tax=Streptomyces gossypii TaxID=2883101 RepID=A0ABT2JQY2_9ACTN|nr:nuclear transport factor 2 family protein [Streptomyces gossypii]MCT2590286.1 nuclear transport factor 2 family protein [Streptomyces gossypii]
MDAQRERSVEAAVEGELRLLEPAVRVSPELVAELLDPGFVEFGRSGRRWDRVTILGAVAPRPSGGGAAESPITVTGMAGVLLAPGIVHLTYVSDDNGHRAWRSSLWRAQGTGREGEDGGGARWRLYFHQATPVDWA